MSHIDYLIRQYLESKASAEEHAELMQMIRSDQYGDAIKEKIAHALKTEMLIHEAPTSAAQDKAEEIFNRIQKDKSPAGKKERVARDRQPMRSTPGVRLGRMIRYAAVLLILAVAGGLLWVGQSATSMDPVMAINTPPDSLTKVANTSAAVKRLTLHDGSTITLEPGSEIYYPEKFTDKREVYLVGNAFFEVTKDASRPFLVYANEVTTRVLGTSFRVKANRGEKEIVVAVKTGKVSVQAKAADHPAEAGAVHEVTLTPNQQAIYKRKEQVVVKQLVEKPEPLITQEPVTTGYTNVQIVTILEALSKSYGVTINYDEEALSTCTLTSDVIEGEGLFEQLEIICHALGGTYIQEVNASISIQTTGCL